jgi:hypothetical protein
MKKTSRKKRKPFSEWDIKPRDQWREYSRPGGGMLKTFAEIGAALGETPRTIRSWYAAKTIPAVVIGRRTVRFRLADVIRALEAREVKEVDVS